MSEIRIDAETGEILSEEGMPTGKTLGQLADESVENMPDDVVTAPIQQLSWSDLGPAPNSSTLALSGITGASLGQFKRNTEASFVVTAEIGEIRSKTLKDKDGFVVGHQRVHVAKAFRVRRLEDVLAEAKGGDEPDRPF